MEKGDKRRPYGPLGSGTAERGANNVKVMSSRAYGPDFSFCVDNFLFLSSLRTFIVQKLYIWHTFVSMVRSLSRQSVVLITLRS